MIVCAASSSALRPFSGSTPAWAARPTIVDRVVGDALAGAHDVAVRPRPLEHERRVVLRRQLSDHRPAERRPDLLVGVADVGDRARTRRTRPPAAPPRRRSPVSSPPFMSDTPGPRAMSPSIENGRAAAVPSSNTVSMWPTSRTPRSAGTREGADQEVAQAWCAVGGLVGPALHLPSAVAEPRLAQVGDRVDARGRVRAAVDVHHLRQGGDEVIEARGGTVAQRKDVHAADASMTTSRHTGGRGWHEQHEEPSSTDGAERSTSSRSTSTRHGPGRCSIRHRGQRRVPLRPVGDRARELGNHAVPDAARARGRRHRGGGRPRRVVGGARRPRRRVAWAMPCGRCRQCLLGRPRRCGHELAQPPRIHRAGDRRGASSGSCTAARSPPIRWSPTPGDPDARGDPACRAPACSGAGSPPVWARRSRPRGVAGRQRRGHRPRRHRSRRRCRARRSPARRRLIAVDVAPAKLEWAVRFGATDLVDALHHGCGRGGPCPHRRRASTSRSRRWAGRSAWPRRSRWWAMPARRWRSVCRRSRRRSRWTGTAPIARPTRRRRRC